MQLTAQQILATDLTAIWSLPKVDYEVTYDDGTLKTVRQRYIIFDRYIWELFKFHPNTPIPYTCSCDSVINGGYYNADTHIKTFERVLQHIVRHNGFIYFNQKKHLLKRISTIVDQMENDILMHASANVFTINALDFVAVDQSKEILALKAGITNTPEGIESAYKQIRQYVGNKETNNRFVDAYRAKAINDNQSNQCIGPVGFRADLSRDVFKIPIKSGFIRGMQTFYELIVESCTAAKALNATGNMIEQSEYASRRVQLLTMIVRGVVDGDCGSTSYLPIIVNERNIESLKGKYYKTATGLQEVYQDSTHLYGEMIQMRTVLGCTHADPTKVCSTCLGSISNNFNNDTNLGYTASAHLMEKISQAILSIKHLMDSVRKATIKLEGNAEKYLYANDNGDIFLRNGLPLDDLTLTLVNSQVSKLVGVLNLGHTNIGLSKIGEISTVYMRNIKAKTAVSETVTVSYKDRNSELTKHFLDHIKSVQLETDNKGNFVIPLKGLDRTKPIFNNPLKEVNMLTFINRIANIIESNKDKITDPIEKLGLLFDITQEKFKCNIFILEIIVYATTAYNVEKNNYSLGRNSPLSRTASNTEIFRHRDFAALAAYEKQMDELKKHPVNAFTDDGRQDHPMNIFFMPEQVVKSS